jgi:hypothetical protein
VVDVLHILRTMKPVEIVLRSRKEGGRKIM